MIGLKKQIAALTVGQWSVLIGLAMAVNGVVFAGIILLYEPGSVEVILAKAAPVVATRTAQPTFTPSLTPTSFPTEQNTAVPTWTPSITPTPADTQTPTPPPPPPTRVVAQVASIALPTPTLTPTPNYDYTGTVRQLTPCENQGKHHIFAYVRDRAGNGIPDMQMRVFWNGGEAILLTGTKMQDAGLADFAMFKGEYFIEVLAPNSQVIGPISPDIPRNETCEENGNTEANSLYHYSFEVIFTKMR